MSKDPKIFYPDGKAIEVAQEKFTIMPFVLKTRMKVLKVVSSVISELAKSKQDTQDMTQAKLTMILINSAGDKLAEIYEIVLNKDREWCEKKITLKDEVNILVAISEVNDLPFLVEQVKNLTAKVKV